MTDAEFEGRVARLEEQARNNPAGYRFRVLMLAVLGNAYLFAVLSLVVALLGATLASMMVLKALAIKLVVVLGVFLWMVLKALWVKLDPPEGLPITAGQAPELFALLTELRRRLGAPRFHRVLLTDDFNAGVAQTPRLGIFGWPRNDLLIGLPLMKSLSVEQFKSVLAHELGHLARGHGKMANWVYRQRRRWSQLWQALEANASRGSFLFKPFLGWFVPYFSAYSFPLARANEYQADATSAQLTSPSAAAAALTGLSVMERFLAERYWPSIHRQADDLAQPAFMPFQRMAERAADELSEADAARWLQEAVEARTGCADTHPALGDRLRAIGETPRWQPPADGAAADRLLGNALDTVTAHFDRSWLERIEGDWMAHHTEVQQAREQLAALDARVAAGETLSLTDAYQRAQLTERIGGDADAALAQYRALVAAAPDDASLLFVLGDRLLARDEEEGFALVEDAMRRDDDYLVAGYECLRDYCWRNGREDEAHAWHRKLLERAELLEAAAEEREPVTTRDVFLPHDLPEQAVTALLASLADIPDLGRLYLVRKQVTLLSERPFYLLAFTVRGWLRWRNRERVRTLLERVRTQGVFPGETLIISIQGENARFGRKMRRVPDARLR